MENNTQKVKHYKFFVKKEIVDGEKYVEHQYRPFPETWEGDWKKGKTFLKRIKIICIIFII